MVCFLKYRNCILFHDVGIISPNTGKYGPEITPYFDTFHEVAFS